MATPPEVAPPFDLQIFIYILPTNRRVFLGFTIMVNLTLAQVRDAVERKRRRDLGALRNPMDIMEGEYGINDPSNPYLQGIDQAGLRNMTSAREVPAIPYGRKGDFTWGGNRRDIRILPQVTDVLDPMRNPSMHLSPNQYEDTMTHEVGHSGEQAVGNYRTWNPGVENRSHNMLYAPNVGGVTDPKNPYFGTTEEHGRGILSDRLGGRTLQTDAHSEAMSPYMGPTSKSWVDVDPVAAQERLADINRTSKFEGLLGLDKESTGSEGFIPAPARAVREIFTPRTESGIGGIEEKAVEEEVVEEIRPTTLKQAQAQGKAHFWHDGKKKLAVTADQLAKFKKSDLYDSDSKKSALSQWANIAQSEGGMKKLFKKKSDKQVAAKVKETKADKQFLDDYMQTYYTGKKKDDPKFREDVKARLKGTVPEAQKKTVANAISSAVKIFGTDKLASGGRMDKATMKKMLQDLGQIESGYRTRIAGGGRPERGFWQVLPSTATDALKNAGAYFGPTFNKTFAGRDWVKSGQSPYESLKNMSQKDISKLLESDDDLGAAFSAVQVLRTFKKKK